MGPYEQDLVLIGMRSGMGVPDRIANSPEIGLGSLFYYMAFQHLSTCRRFQGAMIAWDVIQNYADRAGCDDEQRELLTDIVMAVDAWFLTFLDRRNKGRDIGEGSETRGNGKKPDHIGA